LLEYAGAFMLIYAAITPLDVCCVFLLSACRFREKNGVCRYLRFADVRLQLSAQIFFFFFAALSAAVAAADAVCYAAA